MSYQSASGWQNDNGFVYRVPFRPNDRPKLLFASLWFLKIALCQLAIGEPKGMLGCKQTYWPSKLGFAAGDESFHECVLHGRMQ